MIGPSYQYQASVLRVIDGDTFEVRVDLGFRIYHTIHVRLRNIDTPELRSGNPLEVEHAKAARDYVISVLPARTTVILATAKAAVYNRWEADVYFQQHGIQVSLRNLLIAGDFVKRLTY